jgi:signal peptidase I
MNKETHEMIQAAEAETKKRKSMVREYAEAIIIAMLLALVIRTTVVQAFTIPSGSMIPTLLVGDYILVNKVTLGTSVEIPLTHIELFRIPGFSEPQRGDVVVFKFPLDETRDFIKRVIAVGGEEVSIKGRQVFINGRPLEEPYAIFNDLHPRTAAEYGPVTVPPGSYFVMGDNRDNSQDSRYWGFLKREKIRGKAFMIYWSWDSETRWLRWRRLGKYLP